MARMPSLRTLTNVCHSVEVKFPARATHLNVRSNSTKGSPQVAAGQTVLLARYSPSRHVAREPNRGTRLLYPAFFFPPFVEFFSRLVAAHLFGARAMSSCPSEAMWRPSSTDSVLFLSIPVLLQAAVRGVRQVLLLEIHPPWQHQAARTPDGADRVRGLCRRVVRPGTAPRGAQEGDRGQGPGGARARALGGKGERPRGAMGWSDGRGVGEGGMAEGWETKGPQGLWSGRRRERNKKLGLVWRRAAQSMV